MFVLDTNVVSELRKLKTGRLDGNVAQWFSRSVESTLFLSVATILDLERGILMLERRGRSDAAVLRRWLDTRIIPIFGKRLLSVDLQTVLRCAALHVPDTLPERDAMIAATALVHDFAVVTRNVVGFARMGVRMVNPWEPGRTI